MNDFKTFFKFVVDRTGLTPAEIVKLAESKKIKITGASLSFALNGKTSLAPETIEKLAGILKLNEKEKARLILYSLAAKEKGVAGKTLYGIVEGIESGGIPFVTLPKEKESVPVWSNIKTGSKEANKNTGKIAGVYKLTKDEIQQGYFCMQMQDNSMLKDNIKQGMICKIAPVKENNYNQNDIYAVNAEGLNYWTIRRLKYLYGGNIKLIPNNPEFKEIEIDPSRQKFEIKGVLIESIFKHKGNFQI
jgi:SOS-response transcriptional repressor LexA